MSRHKSVRNLDLDDELDDFDGGEDYDQGAAEELSEEDAEHMRACTVKVREALPNDIPELGDKEIQDSLWHYYYDVEKTVIWLKNQHKPAQEKTPKKKQQPAEQAGKTSSVGGQKQNERTRSGEDALVMVRSILHKHVSSFGAALTIHPKVDMSNSGDIQYSKHNSCSTPFSAAEFFKDCPWLQIPQSRLSEILVEPLYPRGGLLGGSPSGPGTGKVSKLAALAAARKRDNAKSQLERGDSSAKDSTSSTASLLEKLSDRRKTNVSEPIHPQITNVQAQELAGENKLEVISPGQGNKEGSTPDVQEPYPEATVLEEKTTASPSDLQASPSQLAQVMLGTDDGKPLTDSHHTNQTGILTWRDAYRMNGLQSDAFAGPSPDDVVIAAQNNKGAKGGKASANKTNGTKAAEQAADGVSAITIEESSRVRSKNLNVLSEYEKARPKKSANFVVIGHVDHGKSTLMGRLLLDLNVVDGRTMDKFRKESESIGKSSFALAWVLDQTSEERSRGVTMDIATNQFETAKTKFTILDAPGHRDFIPNMIAGASQADFAVLVIDGSPNAFESGLKGQTKEHALLVRSMGVQRIIVAVNKMDLFEWSQPRFQEIEQQTLAFLTAAGFQSKNISFIPCSGLTGENVVAKVTEKAPWYSGPSLVESLDDSEPMARAIEKPLRITINDVFRGGVMNPLSVSGRLDAGSLQIGDAVIAMPSGEKAYIKGIELDSEPREWTVAGQIATLHLTDIDAIHLKTGDILCPPTSPVKNITTFTVKALAFDHLTPMAVDVHRGRLHAAGQIVQLVATLDKSSGQITKKKPKIVQPGTVARIRLEMAQAVPLEAPGRVVLRAGGETVAAGLIE